MKKIAYSLLCALLLVSTAAFAQRPLNRTTKTIVADVLAQMPARDGAQFGDQIRDLASTGREGILQLAGMMLSPGEGSNARVEYALSGLTHWVSAPGREAERLVASNAYIEALAAATDREIKAFFIRQLQLIGKQEALEALSALRDASLKSPATEALASISGNPLPRVAVAPGELAPDAAREAAFAEKMEKATVAKKQKLLRKALTDNDRRYRYAALEIASDYPWLYRTVLTSELPKARPAAVTDILNWLAQEADYHPDRLEELALQASDAATGYLTSGDLETTEAAAGLLSRTGGDQAIHALARLLLDYDEQRVAIGAKALASTKGDVASEVALPSITAPTHAGKIAALKLIADRKSTANAGPVFVHLDSDSPEVQSAAYAALKDVVSANNLGNIYRWLENATPPQQVPVQQALVAALRGLPATERYSAVVERMNAAAPAADKHLYYPVLASTGDAKALGIIVEGFNKESGAAKEAAFKALIGMEGNLTANELLAICNDPAEGAFFDRAFARYTAIISNPSLPYAIRDLKLTDALGIARTDAQKSAILRGFRASGDNNDDPAGTQYAAMMKAGEYLDDKGTQQAAAAAVMNIALGNPQFTGDNVKQLLNRVTEILDNPDADYQRQAIRKHLAEMPDERPFELSDEERREGFTVLFDGTDMDAWTGNKTDYRVQSGTISLYPSRGSGGNLYTAKEYGNFIFRFEFQLTPGANNGVGIRAEQGKDAAYYGMEIQILDHDDPAYRNITPLQVHGSVYGVIGAKRAVLKPAGEWNTEEIVANGDNIKVTLNGEVILDGNIRRAAKDGTADGHEHPGLFNKRGYIGFLGHGSHLKFRNIRIKELP